MAAGYSVETNGAIALVAATTKTVMNVINSATGLFRIVELAVAFDGVSSTAIPVLVELCKSTQAAAGTGTSHTIIQVRGPVRTVQATALRNYSAEPTVLTTVKRWLIHPQTGITVFYPLGREPEQLAASNAYAIRCTAPAGVNIQGHIEFEEG